MNYISLALLSGLTFSIGELVYKFTGISDKLNSTTVILLQWIMGGIISLIFYIWKQKYKETITKNEFIKIFIFSALVLLGNTLYWNSSKLAFNPGVTRALFTGVCAVILTLTSIFLFNRNINKYQLSGILLIIIGVILIQLNK